MSESETETNNPDGINAVKQANEQHPGAMRTNNAAAIKEAYMRAGALFLT